MQDSRTKKRGRFIHRKDRGQIVKWQGLTCNREAFVLLSLDGHGWSLGARIRRGERGKDGQEAGGLVARVLA